MCYQPKVLSLKNNKKGSTSNDSLSSSGFLRFLGPDGEGEVVESDPSTTSQACRLAPEPAGPADLRPWSDEARSVVRALIISRLLPLESGLCNARSMRKSGVGISSLDIVSSSPSWKETVSTGGESKSQVPAVTCAHTRCLPPPQQRPPPGQASGMRARTNTL
jgi:hypothetical protein